MKSVTYKKFRSFAILLLLLLLVVAVVVVGLLLISLRDVHDVDSFPFEPNVTLIPFPIFT